MDLLFNYEKLFEEIIEYKREIEMNNEYFKEYSEPEYYYIFYHSYNTNFYEFFKMINYLFSFIILQYF